MAILYIAAGTHLLHPFFHEHESFDNQRIHYSAHCQQLKPTKAFGDCPICAFLGTVQLSGNARIVAINIVAPRFEKAGQYELALPQKPYNQLTILHIQINI